MNDRSSALIGAALLIGCAALNGWAADTDTYVYADNAEIEGLDPAWSMGEDSQGIILNVYDTLFGFDGNSVDRFVPLVARLVPSRDNGLISPDGRTYTIPIRSGIRFHDGTPLTAEDVRYSLMRDMIIDQEAEFFWTALTGNDGVRDSSGAVRPGAFRELDRAIRAEGDRVVLRLPRPFPPLLQILARWTPVVSKRWASARGDWDGGEKSWTKLAGAKKEDSALLNAENGSGPFVLDRWDRAAKQVVLKRNERYWRAPAKIGWVVVKAEPEILLRKLMLQAGDADAIAVERSTLSQVEGLPGVEIVDDLSNFLVVAPFIEFCFRIQAKGSPYIGSGRLDGDGIPPDFFANVDVRRAFARSFDYDGFIRDVLKGHGSRKASIIPEGSLGGAPRRPAYGFDLEKARADFQKAFGGKVWEKGFRFSLVLPNGNATFMAAAQMLKRAVESLNPRFTNKSVVWDTFSLRIC